MHSATKRLWDKQNGYDPNRNLLFTAVAAHTGADTVLYPGSWVDVAASFAFRAVTYVDSDRQAARFFADRAGLAELIRANQVDDTEREIEFLADDYRHELDLVDESFDLLVSLYAGFISEHSTRYLKVGGHLLVNSSHGDAAMASIDERYRLTAVVKSSSSKGYRVDDQELDTYLIPKKPQRITVERLHELGKGIGYTRTAFAYVFQRVV